MISFWMGMNGLLMLQMVGFLCKVSIILVNRVTFQPLLGFEIKCVFDYRKTYIINKVRQLLMYFVHSVIESRNHVCNQHSCEHVRDFQFRFLNKCWRLERVNQIFKLLLYFLLLYASNRLRLRAKKSLSVSISKGSTQ